MITAPSTFRVIAIISTYNEEDIIVPVVNHLVNEGISVYIIDNWSTDRTWELLNEISPSLIGFERFPKDGPSDTYDWEDILLRKEELSRVLVADWFMHYDADEIRESPWPGVSLKDAIYIVDQQGYNAISFELLNFHPVDNNFQPGADPKEYFKYFQLNTHVYNQYQEKAWKSIGQHVEFAKYGGHHLVFSGKNVCPVKFILRHYPIRSQAHGMEKVFNERNPRTNPVEKQRQWHVQYEDFSTDSNFLKDPAALTEFQPAIYFELLIQHVFKEAHSIQQLSTDLAEREQSIQQLTADLAEREQSIKILKEKIDTYKQQIEQINRRFTQRENRIQKLSDQSSNWEQELDELNTHIQIAEQEVLFYANSKSWAITRPLRKVVKLVRRIFQKGE